jgi:GT2 family glycosyltransferase
MPTLSVCIPVYQTDVRQLVHALCKQLDALGTDAVDIILIDDASSENFRQLNVVEHPKVRFIQQATNLGRARIRNAFVTISSADYLLFIDGDSSIVDSQFLARYLHYLEQHAVEVLVGASVYQETTPDRQHRLRWSYSRERESLNYVQRIQTTHAGFKTNNFIVQRTLLAKFPFDERLVTYGHEDTLLGIQLRQQQIKVSHIDNPVVNRSLDSNQQFLRKTSEALQNLLWIRAHYPAAIWKEFKLLIIYEKLKSRYIFRTSLTFGSIFLPVISICLQTGVAPLVLFDVYRLLKLHQLDKPAS